MGSSKPGNARANAWSMESKHFIDCFPMFNICKH